MSAQELPRARQVLAADSLGARGEQQDAALVLQSAERGTALLLVSDGVGGNSGGRFASQKVMELARKLWEERKGELSDPYADLGLLCRVAHDQINEEGLRRGLSPRATVVALYLSPTQAHWVHSGDSRLYHFRGGELVERTEDHSLLQVMVKQGMLEEEDMGRHPDQGTLLQSLGGEEYKDPTRANATIGPDDGFLLCTDGFWERTTAEEMAALMQGSQEQLQAAVETAVKRNGSKGDNVTAALALPTSAVMSSTVPAAMPAAKPAHGNRKIWLAVIGLLLLALVGAFLVWGFRPDPSHGTADPSAGDAEQSRALKFRSDAVSEMPLPSGPSKVPTKP